MHDEGTHGNVLIGRGARQKEKLNAEIKCQAMALAGIALICLQGSIKGRECIERLDLCRPRNAFKTR